MHRSVARCNSILVVCAEQFEVNYVRSNPRRRDSL
jgi:hypothetical protein